MLRTTGTVYHLEKNRGYGFIRGVDGKSRFFHVRDVEPREKFDDLQVDTPVSFISEEGYTQGNGLRALEVRVEEC